jgi:hypothetical protein
VLTESSTFSFKAPELEYDKSKKNMQMLASGWAKFFDNKEETICPITRCSLTKDGSAYTGTNLQISENAPYKIS